MDDIVVGLLHPGEMGAAVGQRLRELGLTVLWASDKRGADTVARAEKAGLLDVGSVGEMTRQCHVILSICPPHAAVDLARAVHVFTGVYVDANAVSPATARQIAGIIEEGSGKYVDGGIIGPPPDSIGHTRIYLSGPHAGTVKELFAATTVDARVVDGGVGAASAVKMSYAAWTKGTDALLLASRALARSEGVEQVLLTEWEQSLPDLVDRSMSAARSATAKGWRWEGEMQQISAAMGSARLPSGFHESAAEIFRRLSLGDSTLDDESLMRSVASRLLSDRGWKRPSAE